MALAVGAGLVAMAAQAAGNTGTDASISAVQNFSGIPYTAQFCAGCVVKSENTDTYRLGGSHVTAYAMADYGVLKGGITASGAGKDTIARVTSFTAFGDAMTIDLPGLTGRQGWLQAEIVLPWSGAASMSRWVTGSLAFGYRVGTEDWGGQFVIDNGSFVPSLWHGPDFAAPGSPMVFKVPFVFGQPIDILASMTVTTDASTTPLGGDFDVVIDATHSLYWKGISQVTDGQGRVLSGYSVTSDSGTDWSRSFVPPPVPEPGSLALMAAGLGLLGWRRLQAGGSTARRRSRRSTSPGKRWKSSGLVQ